MKYNGVIQKKLSLLDDQVRRLGLHTRGISLETFREDWVIRSMTERALQVCAEILIDIAERIIALEDAGPVESATGAIEKLHQIGVLGSPEPYRSIVRFRNLIVHEYAEIQPDLLYKVLRENLGDFARFRQEIDRAT